MSQIRTCPDCGKPFKQPTMGRPRKRCRDCGRKAQSRRATAWARHSRGTDLPTTCAECGKPLALRQSGMGGQAMVHPECKRDRRNRQKWERANRDTPPEVASVPGRHAETSARVLGPGNHARGNSGPQTAKSLGRAAEYQGRSDRYRRSAVVYQDFEEVCGRDEPLRDFEFSCDGLG